MLDVVGSTNEAIRRFLDFSAKVTDAPLLIDGTTASVRITGLEYAEEIWLIDRVIYNSLTPTLSKRNLKRLRRLV